MRASGNDRLIVVSNRLPYVIYEQDNQWRSRCSSGGLISALLPVLRNRGGLWVGWPGAVTRDQDHAAVQAALNHTIDDVGFSLKPVNLTSSEKSKYYNGFSNEIIWPLFHDMLGKCNFDPEYWQTYQQVNKKFAGVIADHFSSGDFIWVHDYHLMMVGRECRQLGIQSKIGFFLHIPFPALDIFLKLPWRVEILKGLLHYDRLGFQTLRDRRNFVQCVRTLFTDVSMRGKGQVLAIEAGEKTMAMLSTDNSTSAADRRIGTFPISIDYKKFAALAQAGRTRELVNLFTKNLQGRKMILGVDRLDYTKGIPNKLRAFHNALKRYPELLHKVTLIQHVVPSRADIPQYQQLRTEIKQLVSAINGEFTESGWVPVHYIYRELNEFELIAYYVAADIALITPLKDGMNLVAKEYCATNINESGVLILSEFTGAAAQLHEAALIINPYDVEGVADRIYQAVNMPPEQCQQRMRRLRKSIQKNDIFRWVDSFLTTAIEKDLTDYPIVDDYITSANIS